MSLDISSLISEFAEEFSSGGISVVMDEEDTSVDVLESPSDDIAAELVSDRSAYEKQKATLQTYLDSLPYECESIDVMQAKLEYIVGKLIVCAKSKNWLVLTTWDAILQCWLQMRYPMTTSTRATLVRFYYELCLLPGIEVRFIRSWADMLYRLLGSKTVKRKLESTDLQLPWKPLWDVLYKELFPKSRLAEFQGNRNLNNILLYVAESCKRYFPATDIPDMLETFLPILTPDTTLTMIPVLTSFLPPTHTHIYLPVIFRIWEAFNSHIMDDRFLEFAGILAEEHVTGQEGFAGEEGSAAWKDVGIWTQEEWLMLVSKGIESLYVPVGNSGVLRQMLLRHAKVPKSRKQLVGSVPWLNYLYIQWPSMVQYAGIPHPLLGLPSSQSIGYLAGSKALDSLDKLITSTESFFHPSNSGHWTFTLTNLLQRLTVEFADRWLEEQQPSCKTPVAHRLTPSLRRAFVDVLRTPAFLAMFSKDSFSISMAQGALRTMALLEPTLIMPELLERAYGGLEVVNETHRTTAVLKMLSGISLPLVSETIWRPGQKHLLPLLELCLPGIDLRHAACEAWRSLHAPLWFCVVWDAPGEELMEVDTEDTHIPEGVEMSPFVSLGKQEERTLVRESTAGFADWVTSLFRRVLALYENLPEEGGKKKTTGGKSEETVLKSIKSMLDVVTLHLSDQLFDLVLNLVFEYATTNAKSNAIRAFGQLVACLARAQPQKTLDKFLPSCISRIQEELKYGASSVRTTSAHDLVPSDTTLHWNMSILRGCLAYGAHALLNHKEDIINLLSLLLNKTKNERGYTSTAAIVTRVMHALSGVYPSDNRFVNEDVWNQSEFGKSHNIQWGRLYEAKDVKVEWHGYQVPSAEEVQFILDILDRVAAPALDKIETLARSTQHWDEVVRNDFCRQVAVPLVHEEGPKDIVHPCLDPETELEGLLVDHLDVKAGFILTDLNDPRYQQALQHRIRFGNVAHLAAVALRRIQGGEDHLDAVVAVVKAIDTYFLDYGMSRGDFITLQKNFAQSREVNRVSARQKENSRIAWVKRAQVYHCGRLYIHALYRRRSSLDDTLLKEDLAELCLSPYTRVRRLAQNVLHSACGSYVRATRYILPSIFNALSKGNDPDRIKGALYVLGNKGTEPLLRRQYLVALLECQHEEKPSIQKLVTTFSTECLIHLSEEVIRTSAYTAPTPGVDSSIRTLEEEFSPAVIDRKLTKAAVECAVKRIKQCLEETNETVRSILEIASRPTTHWRYVHMAVKFLMGFLRRDAVAPPELVRFFMEQTLSPQPGIRASAEQAIVKTAVLMKIRAYAKTDDELWLCKWQSPFARTISINNPPAFLAQLYQPVHEIDGFYVDLVDTGFLAWTKTIKCYPVNLTNSVPWDSASRQCLQAMHSFIGEGYLTQLATLWSQESSKASGSPHLHAENVIFMITLAKLFNGEHLHLILPVVEPLMTDTDKFKQAAAAEMLTGLLRGSKHWPKQTREELWSWLTPRFDVILAQAKPDTVSYWTSFLEPLVNWILSLHLDFQGDSAFSSKFLSLTKALNIIVVFIDSVGVRFNGVSEKYASIFFNNADSNYAEIRTSIANALCLIAKYQWRPAYPSVDALLAACAESPDPLQIRWKNERFPPPRVSQSRYDKVGLTMLLWLWVSLYSPEACLVRPHAMALLPELLSMSELSDNPELQKYSSAVLRVFSSVHLPPSLTHIVLENLVSAIQSSESWRIRLHALPALVVFFYRNLLTISSNGVLKIMDVLLDCLSDENVEVREMSSKTLSGVVRCSQRQNIIPLKNRFISLARSVKLPSRTHHDYGESLRKLHSAILGLCALIESFPYSVEPWMPSLTEDTQQIRRRSRRRFVHCASEFKKTHQDTWHKDQLAFDEDQLQSLSTMLVGTSYCGLTVSVVGALSDQWPYLQTPR
ncbi:armadillo-type protein [Suillus cothurnatus]|nr:armadillo-type protein [Suillus cothurnatus]